MTITLNSLLGKFISLWFSLPSPWSFFLFFHLYHSPLFHYFALFSIGFYTIDKTAISPSLERVDLCRRWNFHSALPQLLVISQTSVHVQAVDYILHSSQ